MVFTRLLLVVFIRSFLETDQQFTKFSEKANKIQEEEKSREEVQDSMALVFRFPSYHSYRYFKLHSKFLCKSISSRTFFCVSIISFVFPNWINVGFKPSKLHRNSINIRDLSPCLCYCIDVDYLIKTSCVFIIFNCRF